MLFDNIILQTKYFPFERSSPAESVLEGEIRILAENAKQVYVLAFDAPPDREPLYPLPDNVICLGLKTGTLSRLRCILHGMRQQNGDHCFRPDRWLFSRYFLGKAALRRTMLLDSGFADRFCPGKTLLYNFWFFDYALVGLDLADRLKEIYPSMALCCLSRAHGYDLYEYANPTGFLPMRVQLLTGYDQVCPCSRDGERYLQSRYPQFTHKIRHRYLGTTDHGCRSAETEEGFTVVSCSRLVKLKRVDRIIDGLSLLAKQKIPCRWIHIGDGPLREKLEAYARKKLEGTTVSCEFAGAMPHAKVMEFYEETNIHCLVNVSRTEGLPLSVMEAMSFGIPVIATDVGGTGEIVRSGENGFLLPKDFTDQMLVQRLLELRRQGHPFRGNARKSWEENFQLEHNTIAMLQEAADLGSRT